MPGVLVDIAIREGFRHSLFERFEAVLKVKVVVFRDEFGDGHELILL